MPGACGPSVRCPNLRRNAWRVCSSVRPMMPRVIPKAPVSAYGRYNIGAGSTEQGDSSYINRGTRTECFLNEDGTYNWDKQLGQRNFLKLAKKIWRAIYLLGFLNSPPVYYTKNGLATNTGRDGTFNLQEDRYDDFARFMADVVQGLEKHDSVTLDYISPSTNPTDIGTGKARSWRVRPPRSMR